ncbi:MAG TPA: hypothetical protein VF244_00520 [Acidimicrobiales bacterium]
MVLGLVGLVRNLGLVHGAVPTRRRALGLGLGALLSVLAACGGGGGGGQDDPSPAAPATTTTVVPVPVRAERVQACTLLTSAEIQAAVGAAPAGEGTPLAAAVPHICRWRLSGSPSGRTFALAINPASALPADDAAPSLRATPVAGLGDRAEFAADTSQATLIVFIDDTLVSMACACPPTLPTQARLVGLAQTVLSRLE